jgi:hypothetical protein
MWRSASQPSWHAIAQGQPLPLSPRRERIVVRAELRSRHAGITPEAVLFVERVLDVVPPRPVMIASARMRDVLCRTPMPLDLRVRHARRAQLLVAGRVVAEAAGDGRQVLQLRHILCVDACGALPLSVTASDLENQPCELLALDLDVRPRPVSVLVEPAAGRPDNVRVDVEGCEVLGLSAATTGERMPIVSPSFLLTLVAGSATLVDVEVRDDLGQSATHRIELLPQPIQWQQLPTFSDLPLPQQL